MNDALKARYAVPLCSDSSGAYRASARHSCLKRKNSRPPTPVHPAGRPGIDAGVSEHRHS